MYKPARDEYVLLALGKLRRAYYQSFVSFCDKTSLTQTELRILLFLYNNPAQNRAADIAEAKWISKSNVSTAVNTMVNNGLLLRNPDPESRRTIRLSITDEGLVLAREAAEHQRAFFCRILHDVDMSAIEGILCKIAANIDSAGFDKKS